MDVSEKYVMQKVNRKEKSICPNCIHHNLCIAENNQPCFECNRFIDANGVTVQKWIPVTERLPEEGEIVLAFGKRHATSGMFRGTGSKPTLWWWRGNMLKDVTHWMPLPEPPKEGE